MATTKIEPLIVFDVNAETGEIVERELTIDEQTARNAIIAELTANEAQIKARAEALEALIQEQLTK